MFLLQYSFYHVKHRSTHEYDHYQLTFDLSLTWTLACYIYNVVWLKVQEEGWVVCRVFKKRVAATSMRRVSEHDSPCWYDDQVSFMPDLDSPKQTSQSNMNLVYQQLPYNNNPCKKELEFPYQLPREHFLQLPFLESPKIQLQSSSTMEPYGGNHATTLLQEEQVQLQTGHQQNFQAMMYGNNNNNTNNIEEQVTDWRVLDKFVASQLSQDDHAASNSKDNNNSYSSNTAPANMFHSTDNNNGALQFTHLDKQDMVPENAAWK